MAEPLRDRGPGPRNQARSQVADQRSTMVRARRGNPPAGTEGAEPANGRAAGRLFSRRGRPVVRSQRRRCGVRATQFPLGFRCGAFRSESGPIPIRKVRPGGPAAACRWVRLGGKSGSKGSSSSRALNSASESSCAERLRLRARRRWPAWQSRLPPGSSANRSAAQSPWVSGRDGVTGSAASRAGSVNFCSKGGSLWSETGSKSGSGSGQGSGCETRPSPNRLGGGSERSRRPLMD